MNIKRFRQTLAATTLMALALTTSTAGAATSGRIYVRIGPPPAVVERRIASPGPGYVWVPGYHRWDRNVYVWVPGVWARPPRPRAVWVPGHWAQEHGHGWYFVEGHWR